MDVKMCLQNPQQPVQQYASGESVLDVYSSVQFHGMSSSIRFIGIVKLSTFYPMISTMIFAQLDNASESPISQRGVKNAG